jgi:translation initiation factor IF-3
LHRINNEITVPEVRIVGGESEEENGVMNTRKAILLAESKSMDLVEINATQEPPICRIIEYTKFKYEQSKREKEKKKKQHIVLMKEIRFGPNTDEHDFKFKLNHAKKFLEEGNKVKAFVHFRGRSIVYTDRGKVLLLEFADELADCGKVEVLPKLEGKRMYIILTPKVGLPKK